MFVRLVLILIMLPVLQAATWVPATPETGTQPGVVSFLGDATRAGVMPGSGPDPAGDINLAWRNPARLSGSTGGVLVRHRLVLAAGKTVRAIESTSGQTLWSAPVQSAVAAPLDSDGDAVYVPLADGTLLSLEIDTGIERWSSVLPGRGLGAPVFTGHHVLIGASSPPSLFAVDRESGERLWTTPLTNPLRGAPAYSDETVWLATGNGDVHAIDAETGREHWRVVTTARGGAFVSIGEQSVFAVGANGQVTALDRETGERLWQATIGPSASGTATIGESSIYVVHGMGISALDAADGSIEWHQVTSGVIDAAPVLADDVVYAVQSNGTVLALDSRSGDILWRVDSPGSVNLPLLVSDRQILVVDTDGNVVAIANSSH